MKRYNRQRGSAFLMVLMTMAVILVVGTSMLFITLSSFTRSLADTNQTRAYNAASTVSENIKNSVKQIIPEYEDAIKEARNRYDNSLPGAKSEAVPYITLNFQTKNSFGETLIIDHMVVNGAKVYVRMTDIGTSATAVEKVRVDVESQFRQQTGKISFIIDRDVETRKYNLSDTFGNSFVMTSDMGGIEKDLDLVLKRIEGDVSIDCYVDVFNDDGTPVMEDVKNEDGTIKLDKDGNPVQQQKREMVTRYFNPVVLEGVTGSIFANGDLVIGGMDNSIKVRGNIYCDGNLTIRGLDLGVNLPAIYKKSYKKKYIEYSTIANVYFGGIEIPGLDTRVSNRTGKNAKVNETMYKRIRNTNGPDTFEPLQVYDEVTHYTLIDLGIKEFWTNEYTFFDDTIGIKETKQIKITIGEDPNPDFYGAAMYKDEGCSEMIKQYPEGGNIYCSGDIFIDAYNHGNVWSPRETVLGNTVWYKDLAIDPEKPAVNQSFIRGDVFCNGRMVISPVTLWTNFDDGYMDAFNTFFSKNNYVTATDFSTVYSGVKDEKSNFQTAVNALWDEASAGDIVIDYSRFNTYMHYKKVNKKWEKDFLELEKSNANTTGNNWTDTRKGNYTDVADTLTKVDKFFNDMITSLSSGDAVGEGSYNLLKNTFLESMLGKDAALKDFRGILKGVRVDKLTGGTLEDTSLRLLEFAETSNIYIYNTPERKVNSYVGVEGKFAAVTNVNKGSDKTSYEEWQGWTENYGMGYSAGLTLKLASIKVNNVFVNGAIELISSKVGGLGTAVTGENKNRYYKIAELEAEGTIYASKILVSEFREASIKDIIIKEGLNKSTDIDTYLKENMWGVTDANNPYKGSFDVKVGIKDLWDADDKRNSNQYDIVVLRAKYCVEEELSFWRKYITHDWEEKGWYTGSKFMWDPNPYEWQVLYYAWFNGSQWVLYNQVDVIQNNLDVLTENELAVFDILRGKKVDDSGKVTYDHKLSNNKFGLKDTVFMQPVMIKEHNGADEKPSGGNFDVYFWDQRKATKRVWRSYVMSIGTADNKGFVCRAGDILNSDRKILMYYNMNKTDGDWKYSDSEGTAIGSELGKIDNIALKYDDFKHINDMKMVVLYRNNYESLHDGILDSSITDTNCVGARAAATTDVPGQFTNTQAFEGKEYGMYLRASLIVDLKLNNTATVQKVFEEIKSGNFSKVVVQKLNPLTEEAMREKINNGEITVKEYNKFEASEELSKSADNPFYQLGNNLIYTNQFAKLTEFFDPAPRQLSVYNIPLGGKLHSYAAWCYTKSYVIPNGTANNGKSYWLLHNRSDIHTNIRIMKFSDTTGSGNTILPVNSLSCDPLYGEYDESGNMIGGTIDVNRMRSQIDYVINENTYWNFGGEFSGGYDSEISGPVVIGSSFTDKGWQNAQTITNTRRTNIEIDTSKGDVYLYINAPWYTNADGELLHGLRFVKSSIHVTGNNNAYIMLVGDTSVNAGAYTMEVVLQGGSMTSNNVRDDARTGTHFYSGTNNIYKTSFVISGENSENGNVEEDRWAADMRVGAVFIEAVEVGNLFFVGTGANELLIGRGGYINGFVYLPNGTYKNETKGFLGILPVAHSANTSATIVAQNVVIKGSNAGNLIFQAFDVSATGNSGNNNINLDLQNDDEETITYTYNFAGYYYG